MSGKPAGSVDVVVFDCDGVLLVSNQLKVRLFGDVAASAGIDGDGVAAFRRHVRANFGTSRFRLFGLLIDRHGLTDVDVDTLSGRYAEALFDRYVRCQTTPGMAAALADLRARGLPLLVVSGSEERELRRVMAARGLDRLFAGVHGSPTGKAEHLGGILARYDLADDPARLLFVGDAEADWRAAEATGVRFVYMDHYSTAKPRMRGLRAAHAFAEIRDLRALPSVLDAVAGGRALAA